jgi:hypothetical protein
MINKINNVFSDEEIIKIKEVIQSPINSKLDETLGRKTVQLQSNDFGRELNKKLIKIAKEYSSADLLLLGCSYVEYASKYGSPNLPPHFDGDASSLIINYQLESSTSWDIGLNKETYEMQDNSALVFDPNKSIHWRPIKTFNQGEFVSMVFFRFFDKDNPKENEHLRYSLDNDIYKDANTFRNSLFNKI